MLVRHKPQSSQVRLAARSAHAGHDSPLRAFFAHRSTIAAVDTMANAYWAQPVDEVVRQLGSSERGLSFEEAQRRQERDGPNALHRASRSGPIALFLRQLTSPLVLILVVAAILAAALGELVDAAVIVAIVAGSAVLSFTREFAAERTVERLSERLVIRVAVWRDSNKTEVPSTEVVRGDVIALAAGTLIPADGVLLEATDLFVSQAALTGETFPAEKRVGPSTIPSGLADRTGVVFQGTSVRSGMGRAIVTATGPFTVYGQVAARLLERAPTTDFERGIRSFGYLLSRIMAVLVLAVFTANVLDSKPVVDSLLFAMALAVGMSPELLPAIVAVNLSRGAQAMARHGVIVRRLDAIETLGCMDVLCLDKTGTLTAGVVRLEAAVDADGEPSPTVLRDAFLNAVLESGLPNPLDEALREAGQQVGLQTEGVQKLGEVPYDFNRKRLSVAIEEAGAHRLLTKGAFESVLATCTWVVEGTSEVVLDPRRRSALEAYFVARSAEGLRVLGIATRPLVASEKLSRGTEVAMTFRGFLLFSDPPKPGVVATVGALQGLGVELKMMTGDNRQVASHVAQQVGLSAQLLLTGAEIDQIRTDALPQRVAGVQVFAELDPNQKERLLRALQSAGYVVGFLGDGINDAPALHAADVGISVEHAVDVAKEAACLVLLTADLEVLLGGIKAGRKTFANTMKYLLATSSANFGNMASMAVASVGLPFLPLLAKQILLNNFLSDLPAIAIATDGVDPELLASPRRWNLPQIRNFMVLFGLVSSVFDLLLFGLLLWVVRASPEMFRTGWFVASLLTEIAVVFVLRTRRPFLRSRPGPLLLASSVGVGLVAIALPYVGQPLGGYLGFVPLPLTVVALLVAVTALYGVATEATKRVFYRNQPNS